LPITVLRMWPMWNGFAMFGELKSMQTVWPFGAGLGVRGLVALDGGEDFAGERRAAEAEVDERAGGGGGLDDGVRGDLRGDLGGECGRGFAGELGELERAEGDVAVVTVLRRVEAQERFGLVAREAELGDGGEQAGAQVAVQVGQGRGRLEGRAG
jgi:hypothetical protein